MTADAPDAPAPPTPMNREHTVRLVRLVDSPASFLLSDAGLAPRELDLAAVRLLGMPRVLVLGIDPRAVPGMDGDALRAALHQELARFGEHAIDASITLIELDESAEPAIVAALSEHSWDVVVIGGGIRKPEPLLPLFEQVVNLVRRHAPKAAIAFNTSGGDSVEAAKRWL